MAFTTGIRRTQRESYKHEPSFGHYNLNCDSAYSEYCLSFMTLARALLLPTRLAFPDAVPVTGSAQIQVPSAAAEDQNLRTMQSHSSAAPRWWGWGHSVLLGPWPPPCVLHSNTVARATRGLTVRRPVAVQHPEQAEGSGSSARRHSLW